MTKTIEQEAQALVNETITAEHFRILPQYGGKVVPCEALYRTIEQLRAEREAHAATKAEFEAFRREVSDDLHHYFGPKLNDVAQGYLGRFIIPKPDPLAEALREMVLFDATQDDADRLRAALAARGLKLVEVGDATS